MKKYIGILIALAYFVLQFAALPHAGMTWDEPASFFIGRANLKFWTTGSRQYLTDIKNPALFADSPFAFVSGEELYPPFPFLFSSIASSVFAEKLHVMNFIDAHHLGGLVLGAAGMLALYWLALSIGLSLPGAVGATMAYALYPTIVGQMRNDAKDIPLMSMVVIATYFFVRWVQSWGEQKATKTLLLAFAWAISFGCAQASKPTAVVMAGVLGVWLILSFILSSSFRKKRLTPVFLIGLISFGLVAVGICFFAWPWLWDDPVGKLGSVWKFFRVVGLGMPVLYEGTLYRAGINLPLLYPLGILVYQTPVELTVLACTGLIGSIIAYKKTKQVYVFLPMVWLIVAMGRFFVPGVIIYARIRHFIDAMPAFFLLVGLGIDMLGKVGKHKYFAWSVIGIIVIHELMIVINLFPYEPSYFNFLSGGAKTVAERRLVDAEYWGSGVKEAVAVVVRLTGTKKTTLDACYLGHVAIYYAPKTMHVLTNSDTTPADYAIVPNSAAFFGSQLDYLKAHWKEVGTVGRDGAIFYYIYQNISADTRHCGVET